MGGSVAVHVAAKRALSSLAGLVVVDVVEVWVLQNNYLSFVCDYLPMVAQWQSSYAEICEYFREQLWLH